MNPVPFYVAFQLESKAGTFIGYLDQKLIEPVITATSS